MNEEIASPSPDGLPKPRCRTGCEDCDSDTCCEQCCAHCKDSPSPDLIERKDSILKNIDAILTLDAKNVLVPHGIGGMARQLFIEIVSWSERAAAALKATEAERDYYKESMEEARAYMRIETTHAEGAEADLAAAQRIATENADMLAAARVELLRAERFIDTRPIIQKIDATLQIIKELK